jgi:hypothetical protein
MHYVRYSKFLILKSSWSRLTVNVIRAPVMLHRGCPCICQGSWHYILDERIGGASGLDTSYCGGLQIRCAHVLAKVPEDDNYLNES